MLPFNAVEQRETSFQEQTLICQAFESVRCNYTLATRRSKSLFNHIRKALMNPGPAISVEKLSSVKEAFHYLTLGCSFGIFLYMTQWRTIRIQT